jgi:DNA invertase Pin-like site-specific DNA recombinase
MDRKRRTRASRRVRWQAGALLVLVGGDGVLLYVLGAPLVVVPLYGVLAVAIAGGRLWLGRPPAATSAPAPKPEPPLARRALGYVYVEGDAALDEQSQAIATRCAGAGFELVRIVHDRQNGGSRDARPALAWALEQIAEGRAEVLVSGRLRDLSGNVADLTPLLSWFDSDRRTLIAVDLDLDTSTEAGRLAALALAGVGGWERERLSERTRAGLEAARSKGAQSRAAVADVPELQERILAMREQGMTLQAIADQLNADGVPTLRGGAMWRPSSVQSATGYRRPSNHSRGIELPKRNSA